VLDQIWIDAAARLGVPVRRGGDAYVHFTGEELRIAGDEHLDDDDTVAQLVLHELCHWIVEGYAARGVPDWGLDNTDDRDAVREAAAVRLQAHLLGAWGLRGLLYPTTVVRPFYESLGTDALAGDDGSAPLARVAALRAANAPWAPVLRDALAATARSTGGPLHPKTGFPLLDGETTCGGCAWRTAGGRCRVAGGRASVHASERACTRFEAALDCLACAACCRSAYDAVTVGARDPVVRLHPQLVRRHDAGRFDLLRRGDRCAALEGADGGPFGCAIYADRPRTCRDFERGGRHCLEARRRVGLSV
jgi:hypothetical protein